jgi:hypothetical protein
LSVVNFGEIDKIVVEAFVVLLFAVGATRLVVRELRDLKNESRLEMKAPTEAIIVIPILLNIEDDPDGTVRRLSSRSHVRMRRKDGPRQMRRIRSGHSYRPLIKRKPVTQLHGL